MNHKGLTLGKAAKYLGLHPKTLQKYDRQGTLSAQRTPTNRRVWLKSKLDHFLGETSCVVREVIAYCRVSSQAQRPDLRNQRSIVEEFCLARGLANVEFVEEIGGGLNFKRPRFQQIIDKIVSGSVSTLVLAHKDRMLRFGFDLILHLCQKHDCEVLVINNERVSPEQEMVQDLMAITHCFSSRLYGLRNYKKALKDSLKCK